ncbi:MAG: DUF3795 domain-containing protein [Spirochaetales bacterium]|nr:DUF3795 domain-containing protein [Spirochaetales bacterium]
MNEFAVIFNDKCCKIGKCGHPYCVIRNCAIQKKIETCPQCNDYSCEKIIRFSKSEPLLLHDGNRIMELIHG